MRRLTRGDAQGFVRRRCVSGGVSDAVELAGLGRVRNQGGATELRVSAEYAHFTHGYIDACACADPAEGELTGVYPLCAASPATMLNRVRERTLGGEEKCSVRRRLDAMRALRRAASALPITSRRSPSACRGRSCEPTPTGSRRSSRSRPGSRRSFRPCTGFRSRAARVFAGAALLALAAIQPAAAQQNYSGITIAPSSLAVWEGETRTYTVTMTAEPQGTWDQVRVYIKLADASVVAVSGDDLFRVPSDPEFAGIAGFVFFNRLDPNFQSQKTKTVTLTGTDDSAVNTAPRRVTIGHDVEVVDTQSVPKTNTILSSTTGYASVAVTLKDDDTPGIGVEPGALTVPEANDPATPAYENEATYRLRLNADPGAGNTVTVTPVSGNDGTASLTHPLTGVTPSPLTFTGGASGNWDTVQTVTVYGVDDVFDNYRDRRTARITHTISGYPGTAGTPADDPVTVTVTDDDGAVLTVDDARATEGGDLVFTVRLDGANVRGGLRVTPSYTGGTATAGTDYTRNTAALAFSGSKGETQTFTVGTTQDSSAEDDETVTVGLMVSGTPIGVKATDTATGTIVDDDTAGVTVSTSALTVAENATGTYTVRLNTDPGTDSTVTVTTGGVSSEVATVSPSTLTFTGGATGNWATALVVSVTGADDKDRQDGIASIVHTVTGYGAVRSADPVTLTVTDDDTTMLSVSPSSLTIGENGGKQTYTIGVTPPNVENWQSFFVVIQVSDETVATLEQGTFIDYFDGLAFQVTPQNYTTPVTVTVVGVDDDIDNAIARKTTIHHEIVGAGGRANLAPVSVTLTDDDTPGVSISGPPGRVHVYEGESHSYTIVLETQPAGAAMVTPALGASSYGNSVTIEPTSVTFTPDNWNVPQAITLTVGDDDIDEGFGRGISDIQHKVSGYGSVTTARGITLEQLDNDTRGITLSESALTVSETDDPDTSDTAENVATYTVVLDSQPYGGSESVTVKPSVPDGSAATVSPEELVFDAGNWDTPQTVTVTAADDDIDTADRSVEVSHAVEATEFSGYPGFRLDAKVKVTVEDDDTAGVTVSETGVSVAEIDDSDTSGTKENEATWTVVLDSEPAETVTVEVSVPDGSAATVSPEALTFAGGASGNWDTPQTVTARAVNDDIANSPDRTAAVSHAVSGYGSVNAAAGVTVTVRDDDAEPAFGSESIPDQPWVQNIAVDETLPEATGGNGALIYDLSPNLPAGLTFDASARTISGTPTALLAATEYTYTVTDADGDEAELTFSAAVTADTDPAFPGNAAIADGIWTRNVQVATVTLPAATGGNAPLAYDLSPDPPAGLTFDAVARTISGTPTALLAATEYTWTVTDADGDEAELTFTVTVTERVAGLAVAPVEGETTKLGVSWTAWPGAASQVVRWKAGSGGYPDANKASLGASASTYEISGLSAGTDYTVRVDAYDDSSPPRLLAHAEASGTTLGPAPGVTVSATALTVAEVDDTATADKTENQATYTVVLDAQPAADVTVTPATTAGTVIGLSGALTFTTSNWDDAQTVTVTAKDDAIDNAGDKRTAQVTHTVSGAGSGYESVPAAAVDVTVSDDDDAPSGVTLAVDTDGVTAGSQDSVSEGAAATTVTVTATLTGGTTFGESKTVTVAVGSDSDTAVEGTDYGTVADFTVTIAAGASSGSGTFTLTPTDDDADESDEKLSVTGTLAGLTVTGAEVTITDDDTAGVTVSETALTVAEADDPNTSPGKEHEATYTVVLDAQPAADVTVTPATTAGTVIGLSGALTFTSTNWSTPRTVTVTGKNDDADNANDQRTARVTHTVAGAGSGYESVVAAAVDVTVSDDDDAPTGVTLAVDTDGVTAGSQDSVAENAGATTVTVTAALTGGTTFGESKTVTVAVGSDTDTAVEGTDYGTVADFTVTIAAGSSSGSGTFTLTPTDDDADESDETLSVTGTLGSLTVTGAEVTITDDDTVGVTVSATALTVAEVDDTGTADKTENVKTYTVVLDTQPAADVTVTPATTAGTVIRLSGALTFKSTNWSTPRTVTVTAKDDAVDNADDQRTARVTHTVSGAGSGYESVTAAAVDVTVSDDDTESSTGAVTDLTVTPLTVEVAEDGGTATLSIKLANDPAPAGTEQRLASRYDTDVYIERVTRSDGTEVTGRAAMFARLEAVSVSPEAHNYNPLVFTAGASGNWSAARTVTVTGRADDVSGDRTVKLRFAKDTPGASVETVEVTVTVKDDEGGGLTFTPSRVSVSEDGASTATYTVTLAEAPAGDTTVRVSSEDARAATASPSSLTFTTASWSAPRTVTVRGVSDAVAGERRTRIVHRASASVFGWVRVTVRDDDAGMTVSKSSLSVFESGGGNTATYKLALDAKPTGAVTVDIASRNGAAATVSPSSLTFTPRNFATGQVVTVTGTPHVSTSERSTTITHEASGGGYDAVDVETVDVTVRHVGSSVLNVPARSVTVGEDGGTATYTVRPRSDPGVGNSVVVSVSSSDETVATAGPSTLTFTSQSWTAAQTVTVTGVSDDKAGGRRTTVTNTVRGRTETHPVTVTVTDDDGGITVSKAAVEVAEAGGRASWTVVLDAEPTGAVRVTPTSGAVSAATVSPEYLDFTAASWSAPQTVTVTGVDDEEDNAGDQRTATVTHRGLGGGYDEVSAATVEVTVSDDDWSGDVGGEGSTMRVSWSGFPDATGYRVQWRAEGESYSMSERVHTAGAAVREYLVTGLTVGEKYYARVTPLGGQGGETELAEPEEFEHFTPDFIDLYADPGEGDARSIEVEWERVRGAAGYTLEWDVASSGCSALGTTPALAGGRKDVPAGAVPEGEIVFRDRIDGLTPDTNYYVRVTAYSPYGSFAEPDGLSWTDCATPTNTEITEVTVAAVGGSATALDVSWAIGSAANAFPIVGYVVRWKSAGGEYDDAGNRANEAAVDGGTSYRIEGLSAGTAYDVKVTARIQEFPDLPNLLYDGDSAEKDGRTGGGTSGEAPAVTAPLRFRVYHDSGDAEAVGRYDAGLAALRAAGVEPTVVEAKGDGEPARLSGHAVVRLPRFFVGEPLDSGQYPSERNGGLRWLRAYLASGPRLAVADARVSETGGGSLAFRVTLRGAPATPVTVDYASADGTATAGADYTASAGTLTFAVGETQKTVSVSVLDDAHDEGEETLRLVLSNPSGAWFEDKEATGTIVNTDAMPGAWLARFGRTVGSQAVDALGSRFAEGGGSHGTVGGQRIAAGGSSVEALQAAEPPHGSDPDGRDLETRTMTLEELLLGTSFHLSSGEGEPGDPSFAAWGRFAQSGFEGEAGGTSMDGTVTTGFLGADAAWERALAGLMVSHSRSEGTYRGADGPGEVESTLTGVYPYARLALSERVSAWGLAGMGEGALTLEPDGQGAMETDVSLRMGAVGVTGRLLDGAEGLALDLKSDAMWVGTESDAVAGMAASGSEVTRLRLIVDGRRAFALGDGAMFTPNAQAGVRVDGGDAETGTGVELGAGVSYTAGRLVIEGAVRGLVAHEASGYEEWGASGAVRLEPGASGRGLSLVLNPAWGNAANDAERLWQAGDAGELGLGGDFEAQARLEAELGYGFAVGRVPGVVTPYVGFTGAGGESRAWRTGARWRIGPDATLGLEAVRNESAEDNTPEHGVMLRCAVRW